MLDESRKLKDDEVELKVQQVEIKNEYKKIMNENKLLHSKLAMMAGRGKGLKVTLAWAFLATAICLYLYITRDMVMYVRWN